MDIPYHGWAAGPGRPAFPEFSEICAAATPVDIVVAWAAVFAAIGGMILLSGLG